MLIIWGNQIPEEIRVFLLKYHKKNLKYILGNRIVYHSHSACHKFTSHLYESHYNNLFGIKDNFNYSVRADSNNVITFKRKK